MKQLSSIGDTVYMIFYRVNCIGQAEYLLGSLTANLPKTWFMFDRRLHFLWEIEMANIEREKNTTPCPI